MPQQRNQKNKRVANASSGSSSASRAKSRVVRPVSYSPSEDEIIKKRASISQLSISEYIRRASLRRKITTPVTASQWKFHAQLAQLKATTKQLKTVVEASQSGKQSSLNTDAMKLVEELDSLHKEMWAILKENLDISTEESDIDVQ
ncbi:plasmid mobilization protein [Rivularia sp. UHCC 0363]|uniref:plasmid mobilization protein n=1 Tax=Rivularia sp. UHCC 0363 TaxID=3110244 RepID=UPI002B21EFFD|nr:hypothetical protein [Rivularia sp. UHCC 0363]MEA5596982.1 hypothetical protein [Rivularia sp. UHCC 0363]